MIFELVKNSLFVRLLTLFVFQSFSAFLEPRQVEVQPRTDEQHARWSAATTDRTRRKAAATAGSPTAAATATAAAAITSAAATDAASPSAAPASQPS